MTNIVINGNFNDGLNNWNLSLDPNNEITLNTTEGRGGGNCAEFNVAATTESVFMSQIININTVVGRVYEAQFYVKPVGLPTPQTSAGSLIAGNNGEILSFLVSDNASGDGSQFLITDGEYNLITKKFTSNTSQFTLFVSYINNTNNPILFYVDDISIRVSDTNTITNPGFDIGIFPPLYFWNLIAAGINTTIFLSPPRSLQFDIDTNINETKTSLATQNQVSVLIGASYTIEVWVNLLESNLDLYFGFALIPNVGNTDSILLLITNNQNVQTPIPLPTTPGFNQITFSFTATKPAYDLFFQLTTNVANTTSLLFDNASLTNNSVVCFSGDSLILVKTKDTQPSYIPAREILSDVHLVYQINTDTFEPIIYNAITGPSHVMMKIPENLLGQDQPFQDFYVTSGHRIIYQNESVKAGKIKGAKRIEKSEMVYTIVTRDKSHIMVNGLEVLAHGLQDWHEYVDTKKIKWQNNVKN